MPYEEPQNVVRLVKGMVALSRPTADANMPNGYHKFPALA